MLYFIQFILLFLFIIQFVLISKELTCACTYIQGHQINKYKYISKNCGQFFKLLGYLSLKFYLKCLYIMDSKPTLFFRR